MPKPFRVPRTTSMWVVGLHQIIRQHFDLKVTKHEHWEFEQVADFEICGRPGKCTLHGINSDIEFEESMFLPCYEFHTQVYLGVGDMLVRGKKYQLRVHIDHTHWDVGGDMDTIQIWIQDHEGNILRGVFMLMTGTGEPFDAEQDCPERPPSKIDFWQEAVPTA